MVEWEPWGAEAFARAAREAKPVLLSIAADWCRACHEMDGTTYADPSIAAAIGRAFVPVRVDTDRRPDINERYNLGGWPTTAFLTADGRVVTGGTFIARERMAGVLGRVAEAFASQADLRAADGGLPPEPAEFDDAGPPGEEAQIAAIFASFDAEHGGFGVEPKFPHATPLQLALRLFHDSRDSQWRAIVESTLDAMWDGGLWDARGGGFYRYAVTRDWQQPHLEKLLETNAALLGVYAEAAAILGRGVDRQRAAAIAAFITGPLCDERGGFYGSDSGRAIYADANAMAASALLKAASVLGDSAIARAALASFERVVLACYKPGGGLAHATDGVRGLLADQVAAVAALLDAHDLTGGEPYQMMAEEIGHYAVRELADRDGGGFFDRAARPDDIGLLRARRRPFAVNADAAIAFTRLQRISREFDFAPAAAGALDAARRQASRQGPLAAHYILAARQLR